MITPRELQLMMQEEGPGAAYERITRNPRWREGLERLVPPHMQSGIVRYIAFGAASNPGDFLSALVEGDLFEAYRRADSTNIAAMHDWVVFFYNYAPSGVAGRKVGEWPGLMKIEETSG